jgi:hypothetical protein
LHDEERRRTHGWPVLLSLVLLAGSGCADDTPSATTNPFGTGGEDTSPLTFSMTDSTDGATTDVADDTATGTSTTGPEPTTGEDTTTGGEAIPGQTMNQLVSAGERSTSRSYVLVYTFGQPSALQSTHQSSNYRIQGGLIGANGSPP